MSENNTVPSYTPPAGWYPDPQNPSAQRYWNGAMWLDHDVSPAAAGVVTTEVGRKKKKLSWWQWALIALGAVVLISMIGGALGGARSDDDAAADRGRVAAPTSQPAADEADTSVAVPEVVGKTVAEARTLLEAAGFTLTPNEGAGDDWPIITQGPVGGQKAEPGTAVSVIAEAPKPVYTLAQQNAIGKAQSYLRLTGFSRSGLIGQLEFEGFSPEEATFGADNSGADWNAEAAEKAASYLELTTFSREGLYDQMAFEGFTDAEIQFGLAAVGY